MKKNMLSILFACMHLYIVLDAAMYENYIKLHEDLFKNYKLNLRPVFDDATVVNVTVGFLMISLNSISEKDQTMTVSGALILQWKDEILSWNPQDYNGVSYLKVKENNIWKPDIIILNTVDGNAKKGSVELPVAVESDGTAYWLPYGIYMTSCDVQMTFYPFDTQRCQIIVGLLLSYGSEVRLEASKMGIDTSTLSKNGEWVLVSDQVTMNEKGDMTEVALEMEFRRLSQFYVLNIIVPILFLSCVGPVVFALPAECGEKMGYAVTILLAYVFLVTKISDDMPQTSIQIPIISVYLTSMVSISAISVILSAVILRIHHQPEAVKPSSKLQGITRVLRRILCLRDGERRARVTPVIGECLDESNLVSDLQKKYQGENPADVTWKVFVETLDYACFVASISATVIVTVPCLVVMALRLGMTEG